MAEDLYRAADKLDLGNPVMLNAWASFRKKSAGDSAGARQMYADAVSANPDDTRSLQVSMRRTVPSFDHVLKAKSLLLTAWDPCCVTAECINNWH